MTHYLKPHTAEWFAALRKFNPKQAAHAQQIIQLAGSPEVCSVCGDRGAKDYQILRQKFDNDMVATIRLCDDCRNIRRVTMSEDYISLSAGEGTTN